MVSELGMYMGRGKAVGLAWVLALLFVAPASAQDRPRDNDYTERAAEEITAAVEAEDPAEAQEHFQLALDAALEGIAEDPTNALSFLQAGEASVGIGDYAGADTLLVKAEEYWPVYFTEVGQIREAGWFSAYNEGVDLMNSQSYDEAVSRFEDANMLFEGRPEASINLGIVYANTANYDGSIAAFEHALSVIADDEIRSEIDEETLEAWEGTKMIAWETMGQIYLIQDNSMAAMEVFGQLLEVNPENVMALSQLALAMVDAGNADSASVLYDKLLNQPGASGDDYYQIGRGLFQVEDYEGASRAFQRSIDVNPMNPQALLWMTQTLFFGERFEEVIPMAEQLVELDPYNFFGYQFLSQSLLRMGREEEATEMYNQQEALPFHMDQVEIQGDPAGGGSVFGALTNKTLEAGMTLTFNVTFYDTNGQELGSESQDVIVGQAEEQVVFQVDFSSSTAATGFSYTVEGM